MKWKDHSVWAHVSTRREIKISESGIIITIQFNIVRILYADCVFCWIRVVTTIKHYYDNNILVCIQGDRNVLFFKKNITHIRYCLHYKFITYQSWCEIQIILYTWTRYAFVHRTAESLITPIYDNNIINIKYRWW